MNWLQIASVLGLFVVVQTQDYEIFIDPYNADDSLNLDCGNATDHRMVIVFRGNAYAVFAPNLPGCVAREPEPAHFRISDALSDPLCMPDKAYGLEVYSLELVIQVLKVRRHDDPVYMVTCSYVLGGGSVSTVRETDDSKLPRLTNLVYAYSAQSLVTLSVRDVKNEDVDAAQIGSYIQLIGLMTPVGDEVSFRVWNCRAFSNETGIYAERNILFEGCGDDAVIRRDRGFRTTKITDDAGDNLRMARSVFFRAFSLFSNRRLQFECEYLITTTNNTDGPSCKRSPAALAHRQKRSIAYEFNLPSVRTEVIDLARETYRLDQDNDISYTLRTDKQTTNVLRPYQTSKPVPVTTLSQDGLLRQPLVLGLLIMCCLLVAFMLVGGIVLLLARSRIWRSHCVYAQSVPTLDSIYTPDNSTCSKTTKLVK